MSSTAPTDSHPSPRPRGRIRGIRSIVLLYGVFATAWILLSDQLLATWRGGDPDFATLSILKGLAFVGITSALLYVLIGRLARRIDRSGHELRRLGEERMRLASLLEGIVGNSTDSIFAKNEEGRYVLSNLAACSRVGRTNDQVVGHFDRELFDTKEASLIREHDLAVMGQDQPITFEERLTTALGPRVMLVTKAPLHDEAGRAVGMFGIARDITELKANEALLLEQHRQLTALADNLPGFVARIDLAHRYLYVSRGFERIFGYPAGDAVGNAMADVIGVSNYARIEPALRLAATGALQSLVDRIELAGNGRVAWLSTTVIPERDESGAIRTLMIIRVDVSASHQAEQALRALNERLRQYLAVSPVVFYVLEFGGDGARSTWVSDNVERVLGFSPAEALRPDWWPGRMHPEDRNFVDRRQSLLRRHGSLRHEYRFLRRDGSDIWVLDELRLLPGAGDEPARAVGALLDITERRTSEAARSDSEARFRKLFEAAADAIVVLSADCRLADANPQTMHMLGYSLAELRALDVHELLQPHDRSRLDAAVEKSMRGEDTLQEWDIVRKDGTLLRAEVSTRRLSNTTFLAIARDISQRRAAEERLRKLSQAVEQSIESIVITDVRGNIEYVNEAFVNSTGYSREEVIGQNSRLLKSGKTPAEIYASMWRSLVEGQPWTGEFINRRKDGTELIELEIITPLRDADGTITHYVAVKEDITERKRIGEELMRYRNHLEELVDQRTAELAGAKESAEAANRAKSAFLAMMSHEIRTPMNGVIGLIDVLERSSLQAEQSALVATMRESAASLLTIIDDILDFSKIEAGRMELEREPVSLAAIASGVCKVLRPLAERKGVELKLSADPSLPVCIVSDGLRLKQILNNLIGNAIKFSGGPDTPNGRVEVRLEPISAGAVRISVQDNGIGITPEVQQLIFEPFTQAEPGTTRRHGGTGLGLSICRRLVSLLGGSIWVRSAPAQGSIFTVDLPVEPCAPGRTVTRRARPAPTPADPVTACERARRPSILVAEDHDINRIVIASQLKLLGFECELAETGVLALDRWRNGRHALLITDLHMPDMDGLTLAREIRRLEAGSGRRAPILVLTADAMREDSQVEPDIDGYLLKPIRTESLGSAIRQLLSPLSGTEDQLVQPQSDQAASNRMDAVVLDPHSLEALIGDDAAAIERFRRQFVQSARELGARIVSAIDTGAWDEVRSAAHRLKSSALALGAMRLGETAQQIERAACAAEVPDADQLRDQFAEVLRQTLVAFEGPHAKGAIDGQQQAAAPPATAVIVVDDESLQRELFAEQLRHLGAEAVELLESGEQALARIDAVDGPAQAQLLMLLDLSMPGMDGIEVMRHLAERRYSGLLALVSGAEGRVLDTAEKLAQAYRLNVIAHLRKPVGRTQMQELLERWQAFVPSKQRAQPPEYSADSVREAILSGQLVNHYQPKVEVATGRLVGLECLVRWQHPVDGLVYPDRFIGVAERHGLVDALTRQVLVTALGQARAWQDAGLQLAVAVNLSMDNLARVDFTEYVLTSLQRAGVPPGSLALEVTESRLMRDPAAPMDILTRLRLNGIGLSIDDFGTGHSSLAQLRDLPFEELKVDRSFVHGAGRSEVQRAIFIASLQMARELGMRTVAEGVEDRADWDFLHASRCDIAQGYFIGKPMAPGDLQPWMAQWARRRRDLAP